MIFPYRHPLWSQTFPTEISQIEKVAPVFFLCVRFVPPKNHPEHPWKSSKVNLETIMRDESEVHFPLIVVFLLNLGLLILSQVSWEKPDGYENWDPIHMNWRHGIQYSHKRPRWQNGRNTESWLHMLLNVRSQFICMYFMCVVYLIHHTSYKELCLMIIFWLISSNESCEYSAEIK